MRFLRALSGALIAVGLGASVAWADAMQIGWDDLVPPAEVYENPFEDLTSEQIGDLRTILRSRVAEGDQLTEEMKGKAGAATERLIDQGLDIEWLFKQREIVMEKRLTADVSTRPELVGKDIRLPGYLLPLDLKDGRAIEFLLVPTVGACIHTPPPPANQMVHVRYPQGVEIEGLYKPVWIRGTLVSRFSEQTVRYADGATQINVSYAMNADQVDPY